MPRLTKDSIKAGDFIIGGPQPVTGCNADMVYKGAAPAAPAIYGMPLKRRADPPDWSEVEAPSPHK